MHIWNTESNRTIQQFLTEVLRGQREALNLLYPTFDRVVRDGRKRRDLLTVPGYDIDWTNRKVIYHNNPLPYGDSYYEVKYLEGEYIGYDWSVFQKSRIGLDFPDRDPQFPVSRYPAFRTDGQRFFPVIYSLIDDIVCLGRYNESIPWMCWLLFIAQVPYKLWRRAATILIRHDIRLSALMRLIKKDGAGASKSAIWKRLKGPRRVYKREAEKYMRPTVLDIRRQLKNGLESELHRNQDLVYKSSKPLWIRGEEPTDDNNLAICRVSDDYVSRLVDDIIRFFYPADLFHPPLTKPVWARSGTWCEIEGDADLVKQSYSKCRKDALRLRRSRGKRIAARHRVRRSS